MREEWCTLFDYKYIDTEVIGKVEQHQGEVRDLLSRLSASVSGPRVEETKAETQVAKAKKTTIPMPFNLTKPKPRKLLRPLEIQHVRSVPVDPRIYETNYQTVVNRQEERLKASLEHTKAKYDFERDPIKRLFAS